MVKILSQSGDSLADIYDVEGSIAGIDHLETHELPIVHEMGATIFSERFSTAVRRIITPALLQTVSFSQVDSDLPVMPTRLLSLAVISDAGARIQSLALVANDPAVNQDVPIWVYDETNFLPIRLALEGSAVATYDLLLGNIQATNLPNMVGGSGQHSTMVSALALRGITTTFGAGTVFVQALLHLGFAFQRGLSSRGVPFPSW